nr:DUF771 domain-containing protein [Mammaliicoccus sciuri]
MVNTLLNIDLLNELIDQRVEEKLKELRNEQLPREMTMKELVKETGWSEYYIKKNIINRNYFRRKIEPFTTFSKNGRGKFSFDRRKMIEFIEEYKEEIIERAKNG